MPQSDTAIHIKEIINEMGEPFGIKADTIPFVTDSASNMKAAFADGTRFQRMIHRLHTAVRTAWNAILEAELEFKLLLSKNGKNQSDSPKKPWIGLSNFYLHF